MRVCAVVVTFNPGLQTLESQLSALQEQCFVVVVDNGSEPDTLAAINQLCQPPVYHLLALGDNLGIAAAQNRGVAWIEQQQPDCEYVLFLDHDSIPGTDFVGAMQAEYLRLAELEPAIGALGPAIFEPRAGIFYGFHVLDGLRYQRKTPDSMESDAIICSTINSAGTFSPLSVLKQVGPFDESLFIDHVETDWCFRAAEAGFVLMGTRRVSLQHEMGDDVLSINLLVATRVVPYRSPLRHRYLMRNSVAMLKRHYIPMVWRAYCVVKIAVTLLLFGLYAPDRVAQLKSIVAGIGDGLKGRSGKIVLGA